MSASIQLLRQDQEDTLDSNTLMDFSPGSKLSEEASDLAEYARHNRRQVSTFKRQNIVQQFHSAFQLIGGVPRLALWADKNPTAFFSLYSKMIPAAVKVDFTQLDPNAMSEEDLKSVTTDQLKALVLRQAAQEAVEAEVVSPHGS
jgi:hypothetical protein